MKNKLRTDIDLRIDLLETGIILEALLHTSGYDFRQYKREFVARRLTHIMLKYCVDSYQDFVDRLYKDSVFCSNVLYKLSIFFTESFRDSRVFLAIREKVVPIVRTYPFIRVWHAGCSTGEEVYSMAILLHEEGLLKRTKIYATDINEQILLHASQGVFSFEQFQSFDKSYQRAGGKNDLLEYFTAIDRCFIINNFLKEGIFFIHHDLASKQIMNDLNLILCRNVLLYFNKALQQRILKHLCDSLVPRGVLCIGLQEKLELIDGHQPFENTFNDLQIYQKKLYTENYS